MMGLSGKLGRGALRILEWQTSLDMFSNMISMEYD